MGPIGIHPAQTATPAKAVGLKLVERELRVYALICLVVATGSFDLMWALDTQHDAPALVQAVGTLVAIVLAVAVVDLQHKLSDRTQKEESSKRDAILRRALSIRLVPEIRQLHYRCDRVRDLLSEVLQNPGTNHALNPDQTEVEIPPFIDETWHSLYVLGPLTSDLLLNACAQLDEMNKQFATDFPQGVILRPNSPRLEWIKAQRDHFARQSDDLGAVRKAIIEWAGHAASSSG
jgi:hypothetical protein